VQIRNITPEELPRFSTILRDAFQIDPARLDAEWLASKDPAEIFAIFDDLSENQSEDQSKILSILRVTYPQFWLGPTAVKLAGITSVATPPEHRRQRYLNHLLTQIMVQMREKGYAVSALYPFEFPFYKKFGYEQAGDEKTIEVQIGALAKFKSRSSGRWVQKEAEDLVEFDELYNKFCQGRFGMISRQQPYWQNVYFKPHNSRPNTLYIWYDAQGQARAYVVYKMKELEPWRRKLMIQTMAWLDQEAYFEILAFLANHDSQAFAVNFKTAPDDDFANLLDDPRQAQQEIIPGFMLRILDAKLALEQRSWPAGVSGRFSLTLQDNRLEWNDGLTLQVALENGHIQVEAQKLQAENAGLACDIRQLAQLYTGYLSPMRAAKIKLLEVRNQADLETAQAIFSAPGQPAPFMADFW